MTLLPPDSLLDEVHDLTLACLSGEATPEEVKRLEELLQGSDAARRIYAHAILDGYRLRRWATTPEQHASDILDLHEADTAHLLSPISGVEMTETFPGSTLYGDELGDHYSLTAAPLPGLPCTILPGTAGYFSSGWPLAYLVATIVVSIGLLAGAFLHVSQPTQIAREVVSGKPSNPQSLIPNPSPQSPFVGRITGMVDCRWADPTTAVPGPVAVPLGRRYALSSGLLEITYDSGAKVILQGPCTYEVESPAGGYLSIGRLTARVEKKEEGRTKNEELPDSRSSFLIPHSYFAIRTPTATVTDLGTEFGVQVDGRGSVEVHVIEGVVLARVGLKDSGDAKPLRLHEGEAVRVKPQDKAFVAIPCHIAGYVRQLVSRDQQHTPLGGVYCRQVLADQPVAYYRLNETADPIARNAAASDADRPVAPHGTYSDFGVRHGPGNIGQAGPRPFDMVAGKPALGFEADNRAPHFSPSSAAFVQVPDSEGGPLNITGALSLEAWVYVNAYSTLNQGIVAKWWGQLGDSDVHQRSYGLIIENEDPANPHGLCFCLSGDGTPSGATDIRSSRPVPLRQWVHVVATFVPGKSLRLYCDGELLASRTVDVPAHIFDSSAPVWIGIHYTNTALDGLFFDGLIDEVAIYDYAIDDIDGNGEVDIANRAKAHFNAATQAPDTASGNPLPQTTNTIHSK